MQCFDPILCRFVSPQNYFCVSIPTIKRHFKAWHRFQEEDCMERWGVECLGKDSWKNRACRGDFTAHCSLGLKSEQEDCCREGEWVRIG